MPASLMRPPLLVVRDAELAALAHAWTGRRVFVVLGEAGIGEKSLLHEFASIEPGALPVSARPGDVGVAHACAGALAAGRADALCAAAGRRPAPGPGMGVAQTGHARSTGR